MADMYMRNIRDWKDATIMLSFEEKGYFDEIISLIYLYDNCLPDDDNFICRAMPVNKKIHTRLKQKLFKLGLISVQDGFILNSRSTQELLKINSISTQNKDNADKRWSKSRKNKERGNATASKPHKNGMTDRNAESESEGEYLSQEDKSSFDKGNYPKYVFEGKVVKLNFDDYENWRQIYPAIPDFKATVHAADAWIGGKSEKERKGWFSAVSQYLNNQHQKHLNEAKRNPPPEKSDKPDWML